MTETPEPYTQEYLDYVGTEGIVRLSMDPVVLKAFTYWYGEWSQGSTQAEWTEEELRTHTLQHAWADAAEEFRWRDRENDALIAGTVAHAMFHFWDDTILISALRKLNNYLMTHTIDGAPVKK